MAKYSFVTVMVALFFMYGCGPDIENNERIYLEGIVTDINGDPIANIPVEYKVENTILGYGYTDENGKYGFYSLEMDYGGSLIIRINMREGVTNQAYTNNYYSYNYHYSIEKENFYRYDAVLAKRAQLQLQINKTSNATTLDWSLERLDDDCFTFNNEGDINTECFVATTYSQTFTEDVTDYNMVFPSIQGESAWFTYSVDGATPETIEIPLNASSVGFQFEY